MFGYPKVGSTWKGWKVTNVAADAITVQKAQETITLTYMQFAARYL